MKKLALFAILILTVMRLSANVTDSVQVIQISALDSLKQTLRTNQYDSLKAGLYAQIATQYLSQLYVLC